LAGRLADRYGAPLVFLCGAPLCAIGLLGLVAGADTLSVPALLALSALAGAALPPLGALTRGLMTPLLTEERRTRLVAIDATAAALEDHGSRDLAGTFLAIWSAGSLVGGLAAVRWPGRRLERRQQVLLAGATLSALLLVPASSSSTLLAAALFLHGFTQAPLM